MHIYFHPYKLFSLHLTGRKMPDIEEFFAPFPEITFSEEERLSDKIFKFNLSANMISCLKLHVTLFNIKKCFSFANINQK